MQDQALTLDASQSDGRSRAGIKLVDRPDYPITELVDLVAGIQGKREAQRKAALEAFRASHPAPHKRLVMAHHAMARSRWISRIRKGVPVSVSKCSYDLRLGLRVVNVCLPVAQETGRFGSAHRS